MRALLAEDLHSLGTVAGQQHGMAQALHDSGQQQPVRSAVFGDQYGQAASLGRAHLMSNNLSKLEMARVLRTSLLLLTT